MSNCGRRRREGEKKIKRWNDLRLFFWHHFDSNFHLTGVERAIFFFLPISETFFFFFLRVYPWVLTKECGENCLFWLFIFFSFLPFPILPTLPPSPFFFVPISHFCQTQQWRVRCADAPWLPGSALHFLGKGRTGISGMAEMKLASLLLHFFFFDYTRRSEIFVGMYVPWETKFYGTVVVICWNFALPTNIGIVRARARCVTIVVVSAGGRHLICNKVFISLLQRLERQRRC